MRCVSITEPSTVSLPRIQLEASSGLPIEQLSIALEALVKVTTSLSGEVVFLSPGTKIGTIRVGELRIDVKPRLSTTNLVALIRYAFEGDCAVARSETDVGNEGLDELLCRVLVDELDAIRQRGVSRLYVNRKQMLTALRGRPDFLASFPWNDRGMTHLTCRYHELSCNTLDNQLVLAALDVAVLMDVQPTTRGRLNAHRHAWHELAELRSVSWSDFEAAKPKYSRLTQHYRLAHHIGQMIVGRQRPDSLFDATSVVSAGIALNMAELFELAVYRVLREMLEPHGFSIQFQRSDANALRDGEGVRYRNIRPDVQIAFRGVPVAVVDAKYKDYWEATPDTLVPVQRIGNDDLYQLFFYASRLQAAHHLAEAPRAIIITPVASGLELEGKIVIGQRYRRIDYVAGNATSSVSVSLFPLFRFVEELSALKFATRQSVIAVELIRSMNISMPS